MNRLVAVASLSVVALAGSALAVDTISSAQAALGAFATQANQSSFGGGNVLAGAYASIAGGNLNLLATGRAGNGFERFVVFVDNLAGGGAATLPGGVQGIEGAAGLTFDTGFRPQTAIVVNGDGGTIYANFTGNLGGTVATGYVGSFPRTNGGLASPSGGSGSPDLRASFNDAFGGGEFGFGLLSPGSALTYAAATTGAGLSIPMDALGITEHGNFLVAIAILGGDGATISNQWLGPVGDFGGAITGGGATFGNYPGSSGVDLNLVPGNQFFQVPTPGAMGLLVLGGLAIVRRRR